MKSIARLLLAGFVALTILNSCAGAQERDRASWVNPMIGTTNGGNVFSGATMPFGMVQFSPEATPVNKRRPIAAPGGYEYRATKIRGFSLTNVEGWGCAGGSGDVPVMPVTEPIGVSPSSNFRESYTAGFSHADEKAEPGSYRVKLSNGVDVELAAALRMGVATFRFPDGQPARMLIRTSDSEAGSTAAETHVDPQTGTVSGWVTSGNFCGYIGTEDRRPYYTLHFVMRFDRPVTETGAWKDDAVKPGAASIQGGTGFGPKGFAEAGHGSGVWVGFGTGGVVRLRVGISYVSEINATANLEAESRDGASYEMVSARARAAWNKRLSLIETQGGTDEQRTVFTTALYHASMTPTVYSDLNGEYMGMDGKVHRVGARQRVQYANFSGWDVYRSQFQLLTWLDPEQGSDIAQSLYNQSVQDGGRWDRWTHLSGATHVMNGDPAAAAGAESGALGGRAFVVPPALNSRGRAAAVPTIEDLSHDGCPVECVGQRPGLDQWLKLHYIPVGAPAWGPAADTLEDVTAEFSISALAGHLDDHATERKFLERAQYWKNIWNPKAAPEGGYFENRNADGSWALVKDDGDAAPKPFTPSTEDGFVEGSAAQYVWMVPFNEAGLFESMGGREKAVERLDRFFYENGKPTVTNAGPLHAELNNEPSIETPWLYDFAGQPWKTQQLVRQVLDTIWKNAPDGIPGNDDLGEMSSWAVFAAMGMYPEIPGRAEMVLGSPLFTRVTLHRKGGDVQIARDEGGLASPYVRGVKVNGRATSKTWLPESFVVHGGRVEFEVSPNPDKSWGTGVDDAPPSFAVTK